MSAAAPLALAGLILVASAVLLIALVPVLDADLRRHALRRMSANDNAARSARADERRAG